MAKEECNAKLPFCNQFQCSKPKGHYGYHQAIGEEGNLRYFIEWWEKGETKNEES